jgi:hypothetical protein
MVDHLAAGKTKTVVKSTGAVGTHSFLREEQVRQRERADIEPA